MASECQKQWGLSWTYCILVLALACRTWTEFHPPDAVTYACGAAFELSYFKERFLTPQNYK